MADRVIENGPQRTCVACRTSSNKAHLIRFVFGPDGSLLVDYRQKLPGRGAYTCFSRECLHNAVKRKAFQRSFRGLDQAVDFDSLERSVFLEVEQKVMNLLGIARKAGQTVAGSQMVMDRLRNKENSPAFVVLARDISAAIGDKVGHLSTRQGVALFDLCDKAQLGRIVGKDERSVLAVEPGPLAETLLNELARYRQLVREN